jgi:hypothetical protein
MAFQLYTRMGSSESMPTQERMREVLDELDSDDEEHFSVAVIHETEWCLGAYPGGSGAAGEILVWENVESRDNRPRHMNNISRERILKLWIKLSEGRLDEIEQEPWLPGYYGAI